MSVDLTSEYLAQEVVVHGKKDLPGVIGAKPPHSLTAEERRRTVSIEDMFIDIGFDSFEKVSQYVNVGDLITIKRDCLSLQGNYITGKAMDDRVGVAVMLECLKELAKREHIADVYAVCTVQEEVGLRGATTSTYGIVPDIGIAIDVGFGDMPGIPEYDSIKMSNGPGITVGPQVHPKLHERMVKTARDWNIPFSPEATPSPGGTDTYAMQVTRSGIPTMLLSVPIRYMHTPVETVDYTDVIRTGRLLALFIAELDQEFVEGLKCF